RRMIMRDAQPSRHIRGGQRWPVSQRQYAVHALSGLLLHHGIGGFFRSFKSHRHRAVVPRVVQLVAPIGHKRKFYVELLCGCVKRTRLIAELRREQKNSWLHCRGIHSATFIEKIPPAGPLPWLSRWGPTGPAWVPLNSTRAHSGTARPSPRQASADHSLRCVDPTRGSRPARSFRIL